MAFLTRNMSRSRNLDRNENIKGILCNGNKTEWGPIQSVVIRVITKSRESDLFITSMIPDRIGRYGVLLPVLIGMIKMIKI